jgi:predicted RNA methylase
MLSIACALMDCPLVLGVDIDAGALQQARSNVEAFEGLPVDLLQADVCSVGRAIMQGKREYDDEVTCENDDREAHNDTTNAAAVSLPHADIVIMNPPFGAWRKGADSEFLAVAAQVQLRTATAAPGPEYYSLLAACPASTTS